jgi:hypothetical protein
MVEGFEAAHEAERDYLTKHTIEPLPDQPTDEQLEAYAEVAEQYVVVFELQVNAGTIVRHKAFMAIADLAKEDPEGEPDLIKKMYIEARSEFTRQVSFGSCTIGKDRILLDSIEFPGYEELERRAEAAETASEERRGPHGEASRGIPGLQEIAPGIQAGVLTPDMLQRLAGN